VRAPPSPRPGDTGRPAELWTVLFPVHDSVASTRHLLEQWLRDLCWPTKERVNIVVAVNEALTNVADHAYPQGSTVGGAQLYAWVAVEQGQRRIVAVITDHGRWKPAAVDADYRSRGLPTMAASMDSLHVEATPRGTTVVMSSVAIKGEQVSGQVDASSEGTALRQVPTPHDPHGEQWVDRPAVGA
jgi:serine/threonine-protein kinase RsbW